jgi:hypothetical protein
MVIGLGVLLGAAAIGLTGRMLALPPQNALETSAGDGTRAQRKLFALARRRADTVTLSEAEVNALLVHHVVEAGGARLSGLRARLLGDDRLELQARTPLGRALDEVGLGWLEGVLPAAWRARPLRLRAEASLRVEGTSPRRLRLDVDEFAVGNQWLPAPAVRLLVDPAAVGLLQWRLPDHVDRVEIEPGRVVIHTRS